jgi:hypothetical protein
MKFIFRSGMFSIIRLNVALTNFPKLSSRMLERSQSAGLGNG